MSHPPNSATLSNPRILCLHGGGTNGTILRYQARSFITPLSEHFRLVFADAPFFCEPHPGIAGVYDDFGPFRLWFRWKSSQRAPGGGGVDVDAKDGDLKVEEDESRKQEALREEDEVVVREMEYSMRAAMEADDAEGGTGEWVGLLGFSQGAKVAGTVLFDRQLKVDAAQTEKGSSGVDVTQIPGFAGGHWRFGVIMAGRGPFIAVSEVGKRSKSTTAVTKGIDKMATYLDGNTITDEETEEKLGLFPTVHVHGLQDTGLVYHQQWYDKQFDKDSTILVNWEGNHRLPFKPTDVKPIVDAILKAAEVNQ